MPDTLGNPFAFSIHAPTLTSVTGGVDLGLDLLEFQIHMYEGYVGEDQPGMPVVPE